MATIVIAVVDDLFFACKIRGAAEQVGVRVTFVKTLEDAVRSVTENRPSLIIADMNSQRCDAIELAVRLKADREFDSIPLVGFFAHVQTELQQAAQAAGYDRVLPRSAFVKQLGELLSSDYTDLAEKKAKNSHST